MTESFNRLAAALNSPPDGRCPDGCDVTRALFPAAIERELDGLPPDRDFYARLEACSACAAEYIAALDLAFALDESPPHAKDAPPLRPPTTLRFRRSDDEDQPARRVAEEPAEYEDSDEEH
ncbi:MAG: hypothetical protein U0822_16070 [Anaerolineae bacterium]